MRSICQKCIAVLFLILFLSGCDTGTLSENAVASDSSNVESGLSPQSDSSSNPSSDPTQTSLIDAITYQGNLELPVNGASGYAAISLELHEQATSNSAVIRMLDPGQGFTILEETGDWWKISIDGTQVGWVLNTACLINLPDVIPSIVYNNTNAYASRFQSSGKEIPNITGQALYQSLAYNARFGQEEYTVAVLYSMAPKICAAQQLALENGDTLIIYEGFRPYDVQQQVVSNLRTMIETDQEVRAGVEVDPWSIGWFIASGVSNHQQGYAIDVSLGKIFETTQNLCGDYVYTTILEYEEYTMPTEIHELSAAAVSMTVPVASKDPTAWQNVSPSASMNSEALALKAYCTSAGLTPLASEWWHFNDLSCLDIIDDEWKGMFTLAGNHSQLP